jgi:F-type H+-transporting ATPase subunit epsilon
MPTLRLEIVTPEAKTYSEDVDMVTMPGADGELGILPLHTPLMALLKPGELRIRRGGQETSLATGAGFAEVLPDRVSILTDMAVEERAIDEAAAQAALERAQAAIKEAAHGSEEQAMAEAALARMAAQLHLKRKRHGGK